jgi:hypothetical protein
VCWQGAVAANWSDPLKREAASDAWPHLPSSVMSRPRVLP